MGLVGQEARVTSVPDRGWAWGRVLCREKPRTAPPDVKFVPDLPSPGERVMGRDTDWDAPQVRWVYPK